MAKQDSVPFMVKPKRDAYVLPLLAYNRPAFSEIEVHNLITIDLKSYTECRPLHPLVTILLFQCHCQL